MQLVTNSQVKTIEKVLYTGTVKVTGGREGRAQSDDGRLRTDLTPPGGNGTRTNPAQLFAAGWSACFIGAMKHNATGLGMRVPHEVTVDTAIDLATDESGFQLQARLRVSLPGLGLEAAQRLVAAAHETCPYSRATRGNINVQIFVAV